MYGYWVSSPSRGVVTPPPALPKAARRPSALVADGEVVCGDALDVLYSRIAPGSVDLLHTDIPYNLDQAWAAGKRHLESKRGNNRLGRMMTTRVGATVGKYDLKPYDLSPHLAAWQPLMAPGGYVVIWLGDEQLSDAKRALAATFGVSAYTLVWAVTNPSPCLFKARLRSSAQFAVYARVPGPGKGRLFENWPANETSMNVWAGSKVVGGSAEKRKIVPPDDDVGEEGIVGQKPQWLATRVAHLLGVPGGLCVDPHAGTGALLVGAVSCGMRVIGSELRPGWAADAQDWVRQTKSSSLLACARKPAATASCLGPPTFLPTRKA